MFVIYRVIDIAKKLSVFSFITSDTKYRISSIAWSFSLIGASVPALADQRYKPNSRIISVQES